MTDEVAKIAGAIAPLLAEAHVAAFGGKTDYHTRAYDFAVRAHLEGERHYVNTVY